MKSLIIYDLDGTLVDTSADLVQANAYVLSRLGASSEQLDAVSAFAGSGMHDLVAWGLKREDAALVEDAEVLFSTYFARHPYEHARLYPEAVRVLEYFRSGRLQAILTDRPNPFVQELLEALGIAGYFAELIVGNSPYPRKPNPAGVLALLARNRLTPDEALLIGDRPLDVDTGHQAGITTIAIAHDRATLSALQAAGPEATVENLLQFLELAHRSYW